jgi:hypothetical protein
MYCCHLLVNTSMQFIVMDLYIRPNVGTCHFVTGDCVILINQLLLRFVFVCLFIDDTDVGIAGGCCKR